MKTLPKGHASILSPNFRYVPAAATDIGKTFARLRKSRKPEKRPENVRELRRKP